MPAFKNQLSQEQIWQIIAYLRAGFPALDGDAPAKDGGAAQTDDPD